jgi:hypothetical protein
VSSFVRDFRPAQVAIASSRPRSRTATAVAGASLRQMAAPKGSGVTAATATLSAWSALLTRDLRGFVLAVAGVVSLLFPLMLLAVIGVGVSKGSIRHA